MIINFKLFENTNKNYNGIIYYQNIISIKDSLPIDLYLVYIKDINEIYQRHIDINSTQGIMADSLVVSDLLDRLGVNSPYSDTYFITDVNVAEFNNVPVYGSIYQNYSSMNDNDIFLKELPKLNSKKLYIIDVKKVRINSDSTCHFYSNDEIELDNNIKKYNL